MDFELACVMRALKEGKLHSLHVQKLTNGNFRCTIDCVLEADAEYPSTAVAKAAEGVPVHLARKDFRRPF